MNTAIESLIGKPTKEMTAIEFLIYSKYLQWNQNGKPKEPRNDKAGYDAQQAAAELESLLARIAELEAQVAELSLPFADLTATPDDDRAREQGMKEGTG